MKFNLLPVLLVAVGITNALPTESGKYTYLLRSVSI